MGSDHRAIDIMDVPVQLALGIGLRLHRCEELAPDARPLPAVEATGHGAPRAIALRQIAPGAPVRRIHKMPLRMRAMVKGWSASLGFLGWEQGLEPLSHWVLVNSPRFMSPHLRSTWRV